MSTSHVKVPFRAQAGPAKVVLPGATFFTGTVSGVTVNGTARTVSLSCNGTTITISGDDPAFATAADGLVVGGVVATFTL